ncbi:hypothetical protein C1X65_19855 [Pseudomonas sp. FW305-70]|nr:hypothetical protein C1X65_19855 [Pseudomonas sp. FW305-70]
MTIYRSKPNPVGASLLAIADSQATWMLNVPAPSRASRIAAPPLPQWICVVRSPLINCGSELARDC